MRFNRPRLNFVFALVVLVISLATTGCSENLDPHDPEGAYNLYRDALLANDAEGVWARLDPTTRQYFQEQYETLVEMDEMIERYLPATDHKIARRQAGSVLTDRVTDGKGLFLELFQPQNLELEPGHRVGMTVDEIKIDEDETAAVLTTLGNDTLYLSRGEDQQWYVMLVRSSTLVGERMKWLAENRTALQQTVEDLIDEERQKREAIIAELMRLEEEGEETGQENEDGG